jgi:hypothetical protein
VTVLQFSDLSGKIAVTNVDTPIARPVIARKCMMDGGDVRCRVSKGLKMRPHLLESIGDALPQRKTQFARDFQGVESGITIIKFVLFRP